MEFHTYERRWLPGMVGLYNRVTAGEPMAAELTEELFVTLVEGKSYFDPAGLRVAVEDGQVRGWVHACVAAGSESWQDPSKADARIRMLMFEARDLVVGYKLVEEATGWLKGAGRPKALAMDASRGYPFYRGLWFGGEPMLPVTLPAMHAALEVAGYKVNQESVLLCCEMKQKPAELRADVKIDFAEGPAKMAHEPMRESWVGFEPMSTHAMVDGQLAGSVQWVMAPQLASKLGSACMSIWGLGVGETFRRKGIAGALISRAQRVSWDLGARWATVGTQLFNQPAHLSYLKAGYVPYRVCIGREKVFETAAT